MSAINRSFLVPDNMDTMSPGRQTCPNRGLYAVVLREAQAFQAGLGTASYESPIWGIVAQNSGAPFSLTKSRDNANISLLFTYVYT